MEVIDILQQFGIVGVLAYLWLQERKQSQIWQERYIALIERQLPVQKVRPA